MNKSEFLVDSYLDEQNCSILNSGDKVSKHIGDLISHQMKSKYEKNLIENLESSIPAIYIDCESKGGKDIMFYIFQQCIQLLSQENMRKYISKIIAENSIIIDHLEQREENTSGIDINGILDYYDKLFQEYTKDMEEEVIEKILDFENDIVFQGLGNLLELQDIKNIYLYLDNTKFLTIKEKQRINKLIFSRGRIGFNTQIYLKINNGENNRDTRITPIRQRIESPHDYSAKYISEEM